VFVVCSCLLFNFFGFFCFGFLGVFLLLFCFVLVMFWFLSWFCKRVKHLYNKVY
jgi:hypothetical protein